MIEEQNWRTYLADSSYLQGNGKAFRNSYSEIKNMKVVKETRTGEEIAQDVIAKTGISFKEGG